MTKTQIALLRKAADKSHGRVAVQSGCYIGGRRGSYGSRSRDAAKALAKIGYLVLLSQDHGRHIGQYSTDHYCEYVYQITEAGRAALASL